MKRRPLTELQAANKGHEEPRPGGGGSSGAENGPVQFIRYVFGRCVLHNCRYNIYFTCLMVQG